MVYPQENAQEDRNMRNSIYTNNFNNQNALMKTNNQPVLNDAQINDAKLVKKLPSDFPIANWESMNTKAQLKAMQHSGLSDKEQWALLNTTAPLSALNQHNQAQNAVETRATTAKIATTLMSAAAQAAVAQTVSPFKSFINSAPVQSNGLQRKSDMLNEDAKKNPLGKAGGGVGATTTPKDRGNVTPSPRPTSPTLPQTSPSSTAKPNNTPLQSNGLRQELDMLKEDSYKNPFGKTGKGVGAALAPKDKGNVTPSPRPTPATFPQPGPSPTVTPGIDNDTNPFGKSASIEFSSRDKQILFSMLDMDRSLLPVSDRKVVEFIERQIQRGVTTPSQLANFYNTLFSIRAKVTELDWVDDRKAESKGSATWGSELINNQNDYSSVPGSFGSKGNMKDNACGYIAINNANYVLGDKTDYGQTAYNLNSNRGVTTLLGGKSGMNPLVIGSYYRSKGYRVGLYLNTNDIPKNGDAYIMCYLYNYTDRSGKVTTGGHYIAIAYDPNTKKLTAFNNNKKGEIEEKPDFIDFLPAGHKQYCVWVIEDPNKPQNIGSAAVAYEDIF